MRLSAILLFVLPLLGAMAKPPDTKFGECLTNLRDGKFGDKGMEGATNSKGDKVDNVTLATGLKYGLCIEECGLGGGQEPFQWSVFSQQFSSWLLPWLALISQLPFGPRDRLDNLESVVLTVGSPTLAAYSLSLTILNSRWISRLFSKYTYPNVRNAARALSSLQQSPVRLSADTALLSSLVVLPQNDKWWKELIEWLQYPHTWSISAVSSIAWVVIAYVFTVIDSFTSDLRESVNASGQGVGSLWLWLLPIVIGWLQVSPKCDEGRLRNAMERANMLAHIATETQPIPARELPQSRAMFLALTEDDNLRCDERITAPIYNYARFLPWVETVEKISDIFRAASSRYHRHESVDPLVEWVKVDPSEKPHERNRVGSRLQIEWYCGMQGRLSATDNGSVRHRRWGSNVISRITIASALAILLTWGTVGAAIVIVWHTPTIGLGCRSASYILFGVLSTIVWIMLLSSSVLSHFATSAPRSFKGHPARSWPRAIARRLSITLRRLGKLVAAFNAIWIVATCFFQFSNFYDRCYCNSSVFSWRSHAYNVIEITEGDVRDMKSAWVGGTCLAAGTAAIFIGFVVTYINPPPPEELH